jgi:hypothetical protein
LASGSTFLIEAVDFVMVYGDFCGLFFEQNKRTSSLTHIFCSRKDLFFCNCKRFYDTEFLHSINPKKKSFLADKVPKSYICNINLHKFGESQLTWKFSTDGPTPPEKKTNLPQIITSTMKLTCKRKGQAPAISTTDAASIPGTDAGSVSAITFAPNDAMTEVMATTTSGTDTTSIPGTNAVSVLNTINLATSFHDNDTRSVKQEVATGNVSGVEPVAGEATKNIKSTVTTSNHTNIIFDNDAASNPNVKGTATTTGGGITDVVIGPVKPVAGVATKNIESTVTTSNDTDIILDNNAASDPNVKGTATTTSGGITDVVIGPVVANKTPGDEGIVNAVVQVSV